MTNIRSIYAKADVVDTFLKDGIVHVKWHTLFDKDAIEKSCLAQMKEVQSNNADAVIIDLQNCNGTPLPETQQWFLEVLFPGFAKNPSFMGIINVLGQKALTQMGANEWKRTGNSSGLGFEVYDAASIASAEELVAQLREKKALLK